MPFISHSTLERIKADAERRGARNAAPAAKSEPRTVGELLDCYGMPTEEFLKLPVTPSHSPELRPGDVVTLNFDVKLPPR